MENVVITALITVLLPIVGSLVAPFLRKLLKEKIHFYAISIAILTSGFGIATLILGFSIEKGSPVVWNFDWFPSLGIKGGLYLDRFAVIMVALVSFVAMLIVIFSHDYMHGDPSLHRYYFFILFFIGNMLGLVVSDNLLQVFIFWEGVGLASYGLIGFWNRDNENVRSGTKAFLVTRAGDVGLLAAIVLIYFNVGTLNFSEFANFGSLLGQAHLLVPVGLFILTGVAGKSAQFPLQFWLPEAMAGPSTVSALIHAATMVKAGVYLLGRFLPFFTTAATLYPEQVETLFMVIAGIGIFTAFFAGSIGMASHELKKILAFSTISQLGYMTGAIGVAGLLLNTEEAFFASIFHLTSHMAFKALLFLAAGAILHAITTTKDIFEMGGLKRYMPQVTIIFTIGALSLSGIPPLAGYFSKETLFEYLKEYSHETTYGLILYIVAITAAVFTFFYSMRMIAKVFFGKESEHVEEAKKHGHLHDPGPFMLVPLYTLAFLSVVWGFIGGVFEQWLTYNELNFGEAMSWIGHIFGSASGWMVVAIVVIVGGVPAYLYYFAHKRNVLAGTFLNKFLYNRWYWNKLMLTTFVDGSVAVGNALVCAENGIDKATTALGVGTLKLSDTTIIVDQKVVDGAVNGIAKLFQKIGEWLKRIETGFISWYLWLGTAGLAIVLGVVAVIVFI